MTTTQTQVFVKEKTLVLRSRAIQLMMGVRERIAQELHQFDTKIREAKKKERAGIIDDLMNVVKSGVNESLDLLKEEIVSHAPKRVQARPGQNQADLDALYQAELAVYNTYKHLAMKVIGEVMNLYLKALKDVENFVGPLFDMLKNKDKDVDKKVQMFLNQVSQELNAGMDAVFKSAMAEVKALK